MGGNEVYKFSVKRIRKKINDFILNNYHELFFTGKGSAGKADVAEQAAQADTEMSVSVPAEFLTKHLTPEDFIKNPKILQKA